MIERTQTSNFSCPSTDFTFRDPPFYSLFRDITTLRFWGEFSRLLQIALSSPRIIPCSQSLDVPRFIARFTQHSRSLTYSPGPLHIHWAMNIINPFFSFPSPTSIRLHPCCALLGVHMQTRKLRPLKRLEFSVNVHASRPRHLFPVPHLVSLL